MLLVDGPARGTVVSTATQGHVPFAVAPDDLGPPGEPAPPDTVYYPHAVRFLGHTIWLGISGEEMPPPAALFDLLVSAQAKQCEGY
jgi:hypothetical protein